MKRFVDTLILLALVVVIALPLSASAQEKKKGKKKGEAARDQVTQLVEKVEKLNLNDEQKTKVKEVATKFREKIATARAKLPQEVLKALNEARKQLASEGKKGKELDAAVVAAAKLTDEQKKAWAELGELNANFRKEIVALLTDEQREEAGLKGGGKKNR